MKLKPLADFAPPRGPVLTVVMDGIGLSERDEGNALRAANTPVLDYLLRSCPATRLQAHGRAVGMPSDGDMGNSEVGHNAIGSGQVFNQGAALVNEAIASGDLFAARAWQEVVGNVLENDSTLHFLGLFSDGNVHSHVDHLRALIRAAVEAGVRRIRVHVLLDGRDVGDTSALDYLRPFEAFLAGFDSCDARIASGGGRMQVTMDRYEADWDMVARGWAAHVHGDARRFPDAEAAIETARHENPGVIDQDLPAFVVADDDGPVGPVLDGDSVVLFNFRGDRAIEISQAFENDDFTAFDRGRRPRVVFAGMLQYDGDLQLPARFLVPPPAIRHTMGEYLAATGLTQLAISETQKFGHVTYFWNGNRSGQFDAALERYIEIPSDRVPFEQRPWMKSAELTDRLIEELRSGRWQTARVNYANGDMVGHTGNLDATIIAVEAVDLALARLLPVIDEIGGVALVTADHGNAEQMYEFTRDGDVVRDEAGRPKKRTSHSLNPVPFAVYGAGELRLRQDPDLGLANIAATIVNLLGYEAPEMWERGIIER